MKIDINKLKVGDRIRRRSPWYKKLFKFYDYHIYTVAKDYEGKMWFKDWFGGWCMRLEWFKPNPKNPLDTYNHIEDYELL